MRTSDLMKSRSEIEKAYAELARKALLDTSEDAIIGLAPFGLVMEAIDNTHPDQAIAQQLIDVLIGGVETPLQGLATISFALASLADMILEGLAKKVLENEAKCAYTYEQTGVACGAVSYLHAEGLGNIGDHAFVHPGETNANG